MAKLHVSEFFFYVNCRRKFGNIAWQTAGALELLPPKRGATAHAFGRSRLALPTSHESHESHDRIPKLTLDKLHQQSSGPVWWRMKKRQLTALLRPNPKRKFSLRFCQWGHLFLTGPTMIWGKRIPTCKFHWQAWRSAVPPKSLLPEMDFLLLSVGQLIEALMYFPQSRMWHRKNIWLVGHSLESNSFTRCDHEVRFADVKLRSPSRSFLYNGTQAPLKPPMSLFLFPQSWS